MDILSSAASTLNLRPESYEERVAVAPYSPAKQITRKEESNRFDQAMAKQLAPVDEPQKPVDSPSPPDKVEQAEPKPTSQTAVTQDSSSTPTTPTAEAVEAIQQFQVDESIKLVQLAEQGLAPAPGETKGDPMSIIKDAFAAKTAPDLARLSLTSKLTPQPQKTTQAADVLVKEPEVSTSSVQNRNQPSFFESIIKTNQPSNESLTPDLASQKKGQDKGLAQMGQSPQLACTGAQESSLTDVTKVVQPSAGAPAPTWISSFINAGEVIDQVKLNLLQGTKTGEKKITIQLQPPELGKLNIELSVNNKQIDARFYTEHQAVREVVLANLENLRAQLAQEGWNLGKVDVNVGTFKEQGDQRTLGETRMGHQPGKIGSGNFVGQISDTEEILRQWRPPGVGGRVNMFV